MPFAARVNDPTSHGPPLNPGPGSNDVLIAGMKAWRAVPSSMAASIDSLSNAMNSFMTTPVLTPASAASSLAQIQSGMGQAGGAAAGAGAPGAVGAAASGNTALTTTNISLTTAWTTASAAPGGQPAANTAYTEGIKAAAAAAASAVFSAIGAVFDMHNCPIPVPVPPHGPGLVTKGSSTVFINGLPACRQGDKVMEACGGPDPIAVGCPTVDIGDSGGGGGGGGAAGGGGGGAAGGAAAAAAESGDGGGAESAASEEASRAAGTAKAGVVAHTTPEKADELIRKHLASCAKSAIDKKKKIAGSAHVVGEPEWSKAGEAEYGKARWDGGKKDSLNGFVDKNDVVWIHKDRGDPGTMVHEGVHKYGDDALHKTSPPLNEGITEYFARHITGKEKMAPGRRVYQRNYEVAKALVDAIGQETVCKAYFGGDVAALQKEVDDVQGAGTWDKFVEHTKKEEWSKAADLLKPKTE